MILWQKSRYDATLNFPKNYLISSYLGVTLFSCTRKDKIWLSATFRSGKLLGIIGAFSQ